MSGLNPDPSLLVSESMLKTMDQDPNGYLV